MSAFLRKHRYALAIAAIALIGLVVLSQRSGPPPADDFRTARVERRPFNRMIHRRGVLQTQKEETVFAKVQGTIKTLTPQGTLVKRGDLVMTLDDQGFQDARDDLEASIHSREAENEQARANSSKALFLAQQDEIGFTLRLDLESMRLAELKKGPEIPLQIAAESDIKTSQALLNADTDTWQSCQGLADLGYWKKDDARLKKLTMNLDREALAGSNIKLVRLDIIDPNSLAAQQQAVHGAEKNLAAARKKVTMLKANIERDEERYNASMGGLKAQLAKRMEDLAHCTYTAPGDGVVVYAKPRWYPFAPGRQVWDGVKVMSIPDFSKMRVVLTIDEARVGDLHPGMRAEVRPVGWHGAPFMGVVSSVAEKGRDEFEMFQADTVAISGTANRQVFDVSIDVEGESPALRLGLRADADIITTHLESALVVPRMSVGKSSDGQAVVDVETPAGPQRRTVKVLAQDEFEAAVEGVAEGERVWLLEPRKRGAASGGQPLATVQP